MNIRMLLSIACFFLMLNARCQSKLYNFSDPIYCDDIKKGINDPNLYKIIDGRLFFKEEYDKNLIYKVTVDNDKSYYISKELKDKITQTIADEKCQNIIIEKNPANKGLKIVRD
jgi:hypothetical protein